MAEQTLPMAEEKPIHTVILDTAPILRGDPSVSTLLAKCDSILTTPAVIAEVKDENARARLETLLLPFLTLRSPSPSSLQLVQEFARRTGDLPVLSRTDLGVIALAYEVECERNGGDWRLRKVPGQKGLNGSPPGKEVSQGDDQGGNDGELPAEQTADGPESIEQASTVESQSVSSEPKSTDLKTTTVAAGDDSQQSEQQSEAPFLAICPQAPMSWADRLRNPQPQVSTSHVGTSTSPSSTPQSQSTAEPSRPALQPAPASSLPPVSEQTAQDPVAAFTLDSEDVSSTANALAATQLHSSSNDDGSETDDSEGWITPANIKKVQAEEEAAANGMGPKATKKPPAVMQVATITQDFAMQNVMLQMNLNLLSGNLQRVRHVKSFVLRCQACFSTHRDLTKQFCPRCGKPTLSKVSCSTSSQTGALTLHLSKTYQQNNRGERFSIPKAATIGSSGRVTDGGGKGGWAAGMIFAEDQKEYQRAVVDKRRGARKERDLMDEDFLPGVMGGDAQNRSGGRIKVGAGRDVNARRRRK